MGGLAPVSSYLTYPANNSHPGYQCTQLPSSIVVQEQHPAYILGKVLRAGFDKIANWWRGNNPPVEPPSLTPTQLQEAHQIMQYWKGNWENAGFAVDIAPYVGKGNSKLDYRFGLALTENSKTAPENFYIGLYWMGQSGLPNTFINLEEADYDTFMNNLSATFPFLTNDQNPKWYETIERIGTREGKVITRSKKLWDQFLSTIQGHTATDKFALPCDRQEIKDLMTQHNIKIYTEQNKIFRLEDYKGNVPLTPHPAYPDYYIASTIIFHTQEAILGELVWTDNNGLIEITMHEEIEPLVSFAREAVILFPGNVNAVKDWLDHIASS